MRRHAFILCLAACASLQTAAQTPADSIGRVAVADSAATYTTAACTTAATDSVAAIGLKTADQPPADSLIAKSHKKKSFIKRLGGAFVRLFESFSDVDTTYIEPQGYDFAAMVQNTNTYERYRIISEQGNDFSFAPEPKMKFGPYFGWRWLFLGYTVDFNDLKNKSRSTEFDLSLYTAVFGVDLFYRKTGSNYKISRASFNPSYSVNTHPLKNVDFDGINVGIKGFNLYYIFNHRRFSYPAAFSQSTIQRRSAGSWLCGVGYTKHSLKIDWDKLYDTVADRLGEDVASRCMDSNLKMKEIKYTDLSASCGYAYNWVFARNWLAAASVSMALGYKNTTGNGNNDVLSFHDFSMNNFNIDGVGRFGIVWNNMRWFAGMSAIVHSYNYKKTRFSTNSMFGSLNIYFGFNFRKRK